MNQTQERGLEFSMQEFEKSINPIAVPINMPKNNGYLSTFKLHENGDLFRTTAS